MKAYDLPTWKQMPEVKGMPHGFAWGLFDKDGLRDEVGTLNLLTSDVVIEASREIKSGRHVSLNWGLEKQLEPGFARISMHHNIIDWKKNAKEKGTWDAYCYDDEIRINTQSGSQWDGLRHWAHQKTGLYYNGLPHDEVVGSSHLGIEHWNERGCIIGRGVLIDYVAYAEKNGLIFDPMSNHVITLDVVKQIVQECGIELRPGDILLFRTGWTKWHDTHGQDERIECITKGGNFVGIEASERMLEFLWDNHFSAVAADNVGLEACPLREDYILHDYLIAGWGCPIGEMWDLEALSVECARQRRWSFFLSSSPLNVTGGIASPPNAIAVF